MKFTQQFQLFLRLLPKFYIGMFVLLLLFLLLVYWQTWGTYLQSRLNGWATYPAEVIGTTRETIEIKFIDDRNEIHEQISLPAFALSGRELKRIQVARNPKNRKFVYLGEKPSDRGAIIFGLILCATAISWAFVLSGFYFATRYYARFILKHLENKAW